MREAYRRERIPSRVRWWLAAEGMREWYRVLARGLEPHLGDRAKPILSEIGAEMFARRWSVLRETRELPSDERAMPIAMGALYRIDSAPRAAWIFSAMGGAARGPSERLRGLRMLLPMRASERWEEVTVHLGELLIVLTERLPDRLEHARKILGDICFRMGERYGERVKAFFGLDAPVSSTAAAIEVLRMSEYVFRVNPEHWHEANAESGFLEGTACPWFMRPGWNGAHCGIFGQFQSGIASIFGLRYHLAKTIPKHGGTTCRVDLKPIQLRIPR
jgi:hypothetical protein